jgi:hypothetical protein
MTFAAVRLRGPFSCDVALHQWVKMCAFVGVLILEKEMMTS